MKTRLTAALLLLAMLTMTACDSAGSGDKTATSTASVDATGTTENSAASLLIASSGKTDYMIIRPDKDSDGIMIDTLLLIKNSINEKYAVEIMPKTDWLNQYSGETASEFEILLGNTNRPESLAVSESLTSPYAYTIAVVGKKLVIVGGSGNSTYYAAKLFVGNYLGEELRLPADFRVDGTMPLSGELVQLNGIIESECSVTELYNGVVSVYYSLSSSSKYGLQKFTTVQFDPSQTDLYFRVTQGRTYANQLTTVGDTVKAFNENNTEGLTAVSAVNGDLWMVSYAHARISGKGTVYKDCSDAVVTKSLTVPRGFNMYNGEIITSAHMQQETPYEGKFYSFGITEDGQAVLGCPQVGIKISNTTQNTTASGDGLNRLPANDALVMYSDVYSASNYSLSDACEIVIDCGYDYTVCHGAKITGTVTAITKPGGTKYDMKANRIILTARGTKTDSVSGYAIGDKIEINITVTDSMGKSAVWQKMKNAVGGHIPVIVDGVSKNSGDTTKYPMSVLGIKADGSVVMLTNDGRQTGWSTGIMISQLDELCSDLGIVTAFLLDGGGSAEMVNLIDGKYQTVNKPSDSSSRTVVNTVILAFGPEKEG